MMFIGAVVFFALAYVLYGKFLSNVFNLDNNNKTPAEVYFDGVDYVPAHPAVLLGHHFASIAGAGPIVGPIAAASMFGWLPAYIWCLVGSVFLGGVHDMGALVASIRHKGLSMGEVVERWIGHKGKKLYLTFTWLTLVLVVAVFMELAAQTLAADPAVAFSAVLYIVMALIFGVLIYRMGLSLFISTLVMVPVIIGAVFYADSVEWVPRFFAFGRDLATPEGKASLVNMWRIALVVYVFAASVLPVWLLLQPRDYLASYLLYFSVAIGAIGMIFGRNFDVSAYPAFTGFISAKGDFLWPILFITVACGAISGFHSMVGSGTTAKQIRREKDALLVGYGSMLIEGIVAVIAIGTVMMAGKILEGGPTVTYGKGLGQFASLVGINPRVGASLGLLALNSFILTTLDTATRLARYQLQELTEMKIDRYTATIIGVVAALFLVFYKTGGKSAWQLIWPVFGAANQLVAALALLALSVWVKRGLKKPNGFTMVPMFFMFVTTMAALALLIKANLGNFLLAGVSILLFVLAIMLAKEAWGALQKGPEK